MTHWRLVLLVLYLGGLLVYWFAAPRDSAEEVVAEAAFFGVALDVRFVRAVIAASVVLWPATVLVRLAAGVWLRRRG